MKIILLSMPDIAPIILHETAIHTPNLGIASVGANLDPHHEVHIIDLVRKRRSIKKYLAATLRRVNPHLVGFSAMTWQYDTCVKLIRLVKQLLPSVRIALGGYHATLMYEEIATSSEAAYIDFIVRGEGEEAFRRLVNALNGDDALEEIPSISFKSKGRFIHNPRGPLQNLAELKLPIRDKRRLTWGYHLMYYKMEVLETSRGCTRNCNFCSMRHMYGRSFRPFPIERVLADIDDIYYNRKTRWAFVVDDNLVLDQNRVIALCDAIIARNYKKLRLVVQADCVSMSRNETMVRKMAQAGFKIVFLGIENVSKQNLKLAHKGDIIAASKRAMELCHKYDLMVIGGLIFGFPDDDEEDIINNYKFLNEIESDAALCQILTPYPKTGLRAQLIADGLVTNESDYKKYNGLWANVKTRHLDADTLQYLYWYHKQKVLGWWNPSKLARSSGPLWTWIWVTSVKPLMRYFINRTLRKRGWRGRYKREVRRLAGINTFHDIDHY
jgi:radical SAM superfamily enzyme YgiQ (UPF0313 family)